MKEDRIVWVEYGGAPLTIVRIFRNKTAAYAFMSPYSQVCGVQMRRSRVPIGQERYTLAVSVIRHQLWLRCKGFCEMCGDTVIEKSGHMHEVKHRGKGGEISLANSVFICPKCHDLQHGDRKPQWTKSEKNA